MDHLKKEIINILLNDNENYLVYWLISLLPFSDQSFIDIHGNALFYGTGHHYFFRDTGEMIEHMSDSFEKLADSRLRKKLKNFQNEVPKTGTPRKPRTKSERPIVKKHIITKLSDDLEKERIRSCAPAEIEVESPKGPTKFVRNTSECSFDNPAKIDIED